MDIDSLKIYKKFGPPIVETYSKVGVYSIEYSLLWLHLHINIRYIINFKKIMILKENSYLWSYYIEQYYLAQFNLICDMIDQRGMSRMSDFF